MLAMTEELSKVMTWSWALLSGIQSSKFGFVEY